LFVTYATRVGARYPITGHWVSGSVVLAWSGRVESAHGVTLSDSYFDPVLTFNTRIYRRTVCSE